MVVLGPYFGTKSDRHPTTKQFQMMSVIYIIHPCIVIDKCKSQNTYTAGAAADGTQSQSFRESYICHVIWIWTSIAFERLWHSGQDHWHKEGRASLQAAGGQEALGLHHGEGPAGQRGSAVVHPRQDDEAWFRHRAPRQPRQVKASDGEKTSLKFSSLWRFIGVRTTSPKPLHILLIDNLF